MAVQARTRTNAPQAGPLPSVMPAGPLQLAVPRAVRPVVEDQAAKLRAMTQGGNHSVTSNAANGQHSTVHHRASVIAVTSGKGGVGKSNVAVNLCIKLSAAGKRVILLDADLGLANADVLCNVSLDGNLAHFVARQRALSEVMVDAPGGFKLIGGASGLARMADLTDFDRQRMIQSMGELEAQADVIVIDTGAGISPNVLAFTRGADDVLVVTTPEPTAITDAYAVVKVLNRQENNLPGRRVSLLVNMALSPNEGAAVYERISKVARQFLGVGLLDAGYILSDPAVPLAVRRRVPFSIASPDSPASRCVQQLAARLGHTARHEAQRSGFFDRMSSWLFG